MKINMRGSLKKNYGGGGGTQTVSSIPDWAVPYMTNVGKAGEAAYASGKLGQVAGASQLQQQAFNQGAQGMAQAGSIGGNTLFNQQNRLSGLAGQGLDTSATDNILMSQANRLSNMAQTPSAETLAAQKDAIVLGAQQKVAGLNTNFGQAGTLGSARQAVMQGAQNAATTGELAKVDADYENKMFQNRLAAEQMLGNTSSGLLNAQNQDAQARLAAENALGNSVSGMGSLASNTASGLANLGNQQRGIDQQGLDASWQGLQRYASTIYGNPARQQGVSGGK